jgi:hypothetical protein
MPSSYIQIPIFLAEMSPAAFRATFPGVVYQLGNVGSALRSELRHGLLMRVVQMISSSASQIEASTFLARRLAY